MIIRLMKSFEIDPKVRNYDYSKFAVYTNSGSYLTNIYKHDKLFYNLFESTPHKTSEDCLKSLKSFIKVKENNKN